MNIEKIEKISYFIVVIIILLVIFLGSLNKGGFFLLEVMKRDSNNYVQIVLPYTYSEDSKEFKSFEYLGQHLYFYTDIETDVGDLKYYNTLSKNLSDVEGFVMVTTPIMSDKIITEYTQKDEEVVPIKNQIITIYYENVFDSIVKYESETNIFKKWKMSLDYLKDYLSINNLLSIIVPSCLTILLFEGVIKDLLGYILKKIFK